MYVEFSKDVGFTDFSIIFSEHDLTNKIYTRYLFLIVFSMWFQQLCSI